MVTGLEDAIARLAEPLGTIVGTAIITVGAAWGAWRVGRQRHHGRAPDDQPSGPSDGTRILAAVEANHTLIERVLNTLALQEAFRQGREAGERDHERWRPPP